MPDAPPITEFEYPDAKRENLPPAGSPTSEPLAEQSKVRFANNPHRTPALRSNERIAHSSHGGCERDAKWARPKMLMHRWTRP